jgi:Transglycosylase SLT domain
MAFVRLLWLVVLLIVSAPGQASVNLGACMVSASEYHKVNPHILRAILSVESGMRPEVIGRNKNGSIDVGIAGINSIHFNDLAKHGITPQKLLDPCVSTYVAAWKLSKHMARFGNNWYGIAAYHSKTPHLNARYQILLHNELVKQGVIAGRKFPVPQPMTRPDVSSTTAAFR